MGTAPVYGITAQEGRYCATRTGHAPTWCHVAVPDYSGFLTIETTSGKEEISQGVCCPWLFCSTARRTCLNISLRRRPAVPICC